MPTMEGKISDAGLGTLEGDLTKSDPTKDGISGLKFRRTYLRSAFTKACNKLKLAIESDEDTGKFTGALAILKERFENL